MRVAIVGSGISGNAAARMLAVEHCVDLFESDTHVGGHAKTVSVEAYGQSVSADVAFMVLNERTYPNLCQLFKILGVETQDSDMSLSVRCQAQHLLVKRLWWARGSGRLGAEGRGSGPSPGREQRRRGTVQHPWRGGM